MPTLLTSTVVGGIGAARVASACYKLVISSMLPSCYTTAGALFLSAATHPSSCVCIIRQHHSLFLLFSVHCWYSSQWGLKVLSRSGSIQKKHPETASLPHQLPSSSTQAALSAVLKMTRCVLSLTPWWDAGRGGVGLWTVQACHGLAAPHSATYYIQYPVSSNPLLMAVWPGQHLVGP